MSKSIVAAVLGFTCLAGAASLALAGTAQAYAGQQNAPQAQVSLAQARQIAQRAQPGTITDEELEHESGGSGLRYSFDIKAGAATHEVGVDARTGKLLENSVEGAHPD